MSTSSTVRFAAITIAAITFSLAACGGESKPADTAAAAPSATGAPASGDLAPDPGGKVIVVQMMTDEQGNNRFDPKEVEAHRGDVVRFTLKAGVHNVDFLPDSNAVKTGLPPKPSDLLQLPGQTYDVKVSMPKGHYYFQCDPHAALGMKGKLEVE